MNRFKNRLSLASFSDNAIEIIKKYDIAMELNHCCISDYLNEDVFENTLQEAIKDIELCGGKAFIMHGPFTEIIPASIDSRAIKLGLDRLNEAYKFASRLGIKSMVVHTGYVSQIYQKGWHKEKSVYFWKKFMEDKPLDFKIFIENVFEDEPFTLIEMIDEIDDERIKICLDTGHCNVYKKGTISVTEWMDIIGHRLGHMHIHNNFGDRDEHLSILEGDINFDDVINKLIEIDKNNDITITIESRVSESSIEKILSY